MASDERLRRTAAVLLVGPPGSGKSTLGRAIATLPGFAFASAGEMFRALDDHTEAQREALAHVERGELVPAELAVALFVEHLRARVVLGSFTPEDELLLLDGLPRVREQAELLAPFFAPRRLIALEAPREVLAARSRGRGRGDDADAIFEARLGRYEAQTRPLLAHFPDRTRTVDAAQGPAAVLRDVLTHVAPVHEEWAREEPG
jgi:adenylate kinase